MDRDKVREMVMKVVEDQLGPFRSEVTDKSSFDKDLGADSLDKVEMIMELEDRFEISVDDDEIEKLQTIGEVVDFLVKRLKK